MGNYIAKDQIVVENNTYDKYETVPFLPPKKGRIAEGGLRTKGHFKRGLPGRPLVSIITVVLNNDKYLEQTILSVTSQSYDNVEYLIIDGGSSDRTLEIIDKYESVIDYWISEKDNGTSEAINKGISLAFGDIIGFINSDDWYEKDSIFEIASAFGLNKEAAIICGRLKMADGPKKGQVIMSVPSDLYKNMTVETPATFFKKTVFKQYGVFDSQYKVGNDYELFLRFYMSKVKFLTIKKVIANMRFNGMSQKKWLQAFKDVRQAQIKLTGKKFMATMLFIYKVTRFSFKNLLEKRTPFIILFYRKYFSRYYRNVKNPDYN